MPWVLWNVTATPAVQHKRCGCYQRLYTGECVVGDALSMGIDDDDITQSVTEIKRRVENNVF